MRTHLLPKLVGIWLILGASAVACAQSASAPSQENLRLSWTDDPMRGGWRAVCGNVYNSWHVPALSALQFIFRYSDHPSAPYLSPGTSRPYQSAARRAKR